ncbi:NADP oxidoreductase, partial [Leifsonia sp. SIMBA_070]
GRRALGVASDHPEPAALVASLTEDAGYAAVLVPALRDGAAFEPGGPVFCAQLDAAGFRTAIEDETGLVA